MMRRLPMMPVPRPIALLAGALALGVLACSAERTSTGPRPSEAAPLDPETGSDAPINLAYVCGNRFVLSNTRDVPVTVTYRVAGSEEEGTADLDAAPRMDPAVTERAIELRTTGVVELYLGGHIVVARANDGVPCAAEVGGAALASATGAETGKWSAPFSWPIVAIHMALLPDGRVLALGRLGTPQVWAPLSGQFTSVPSPAWLFCAGQTLLPDGRVFFAGGHIDYDFGLPNTTLFDPVTNA